MALHTRSAAARRAEDQFDDETITRDFGKANGIAPSALDAEAPEAPFLPVPTANISPESSTVPRMVAVWLISLSFNTLLYTVVEDLNGPELGLASRKLEEVWQIVPLFGWKVAQLSVAWLAGYDYQDVAAFAFLTNMPYYYLLYSFWSLQPVAIVCALAIDLVSAAVPFAIMRSRNQIHSLEHATTNEQKLAHDWQVLLSAVTYGAAIYAVTFWAIYQSGWLSTFLVVHFDEIPSLERIYDSTLPYLLALFMLNGAASMSFLFRSAMGAKVTSSTSKPPRRFNAETATLGQTFAYNLGLTAESGWSDRSHVLMMRTLTLIACTFANVAVRVFGTVQGTDVAGSLGYAGLWALASASVGIAYAFLMS